MYFQRGHFRNITRDFDRSNHQVLFLLAAPILARLGRHWDPAAEKAEDNFHLSTRSQKGAHLSPSKLFLEIDIDNSPLPNSPYKYLALPRPMRFTCTWCLTRPLPILPLNIPVPHLQCSSPHLPSHLICAPRTCSRPGNIEFLSLISKRRSGVKSGGKLDSLSAVV